VRAECASHRLVHAGESTVLVVQLDRKRPWAIRTRSTARLTRSAASTEVALFYVDASALVKLVRQEAESDALRAFLEDADLISSELVLTEVPRAIRRAVAHDSRLPIDGFLSYDERQSAAARLAGLRT